VTVLTNADGRPTGDLTTDDPTTGDPTADERADERAETSLPSLPDRWQPTRAGIVNAWRYLDEVLSFHRGRLLLRGPNGSGKSMALELLLPFLLDANAGQHRLSSAAKARGGLFDRLVGEDTGSQAKVAFLWVEFRRAACESAGAGSREVCTVGVRLRASASTRQVDKLWFITPQVVGDDLALLDEARVPLARAALTEQVEAGGGRTFDDASAYRTRVRETLYPGFGEEQYDAVITALLALRQEKLSQNLDLDRLSATLSSALPPLDEREVADAAEGFRQLDQRRDNLEQLERDLEVVQRLRRRQRTYARAMLQGRSGEVIAAATARDKVTRRERETAAELDEARHAETQLVAEEDRRLDRLAELAGEIDALQQRDAFREGGTLEALRDETRRARRAAEGDRQRHTAAVGRAETAATETVDAEALAAAAARHVADALDELAATADRTGADAVLAAAAADGPEPAAAMLSAWIDRRRDQLAAVREALDALEDAIRTRDQLAERREEAAALRERRLDGRDAADAEVDGAISALRSALSSWLAQLEVLDAAELHGLPSLENDLLEGLADRVGSVVAHQREELAAADARWAAADAGLAEERAEVAEHRQRLADSPAPELVAPAWRRDRTALEGAPLWRLLDVRDHVDADTAGRLEAGLAAAGLLDAWVHPDGRVEVAEGEADVFAVPSERVAQGPAGTLAEVLRVEDQDRVPTEVVERVLTAVALADTVADVAGDADWPSTVVGRDGTFRIGALAGRGPVGEAGYLGATAREQRRQRQLAELDRQLADLDARRETLVAERAALTRRREQLDDEVARQPTTDALRGARERARVAQARLDDADTQLADLAHRYGEAEDAVRGRQRRLTAAAAEHELPTSRSRLDELASLLQRLDRQVAAWVGRRRELAAARRAADRQAEVARQAAEHAAELDEQAATSDRVHRELAARLRALDETVGHEYREVVALIEACRQEQTQLEERGRSLQDERLALRDRLGRLAGALEAVEQERQEVERHRQLTHDRLLGLLRDGFGADADVEVAPPDGDDVGVTVVLETARELARQLEGVEGDEAAVDQAHARVEEGRHVAAEQLGGRADLTATRAEGGWWLLRARVEGTSMTVTGLRDALAGDLASARGELADHERELYDRTLTEGLRRHLVGRIRRATELTQRINHQLRKVETEAGVAVQLEWVVGEHGEAVAQARPLLLKDPADLREADRDALHGFLRARIDLVRDPDDSDDTSWEGRLLRAFDYRAWHTFRLKVSHQAWGREFRPATAKRLQQLSTGERSVVLHLPMLASIAAHYDAGGQDEARCPRLILLDELFVGVDPINRAQLFGMFVEWDLDAVLTSDHEWCRYASLDGIAIHQVHADADPVVTTRFVWDGHRKQVTAVDGPAIGAGR
jgi:uncharacterized protein (TIGR02680 family)